MPKNTTRWTRVRTWGIPLGAAVGGAGICAGAFALWGTGGDDAQAASAMDGAAQQQTVTVGLQTLEQSVSATGSLAAVKSDSLAFAASGKVTKVDVEAGDTVKKGDVIATIDTLQLTASLRSAQADLAQARATLSNLEDAADGSDASDAQIAAATAQVKVLKQNVADAKDAMSDAKLVADIDGLVTEQPYEVGDVVSSGSSGSGSTGSTGSSGATGGASMGGSSTAASSTSTSTGVTIVGQDEWTVTVSLDETEVAEIEKGDQVTFTSDDVDQEFYGIVTDIANLPTTTGGTATYDVDLQVTGDVAGLYEGTSVTADIVYLRQVDVLAVPANAVTTTDGTSTVTVVDAEGTESQVEVTVGDTVGQYTEITSGLAEGDQIVMTVTTGRGSNGSSGSDQTMQGYGQLPTDGTFPGGGEMPTGGQLPGGMGALPGQ
ncbi:efflux RND transporter periplasmic adaptor subunit [Demequina soli]|uniref:efflux RND transporter periplasmic adaptor subunit n=1 Tax=Demequina soli TaxID=1638987 RepID=UPI0007860E4D|nr:biotin/lipoyl-binding protein [Demequina soli]